MRSYYSCVCVFYVLICRCVYRVCEYMQRLEIDTGGLAQFLSSFFWDRVWNLEAGWPMGSRGPLVSDAPPSPRTVVIYHPSQAFTWVIVTKTQKLKPDTDWAHYPSSRGLILERAQDRVPRWEISSNLHRLYISHPCLKLLKFENPSSVFIT